MFYVRNQFLLKFKRKEKEHFESFSALCEKKTHTLQENILHILCSVIRNVSYLHSPFKTKRKKILTFNKEKRFRQMFTIDLEPNILLMTLLSLPLSLPPSSPGPTGGEWISSEDQKPGPGGFWDVPVRGREQTRHHLLHSGAPSPR